MARVTLLRNVSLGGKDLSLTSADLLASRGNLRLQVVIGPILLIEQETSIIDFFLETAVSHHVRVCTSLEVVVLEQFFSLEVPVLGLDGVKLVAQGEVVLVALLDLEDLRLQLRNEKVLLVRCQVHTVVILVSSIDTKSQHSR